MSQAAAADTLFPLPDHPSAGRPDRSPRRPRRLAARLCVLGSGSGGNATVLACGNNVLLIDAGFGPRTTAARLAQAKIGLDQIRAICLTHFDRDHFRPSWINALLKHRITLHLHCWHEPDLLRIRGARALIDAGLTRTFNGEPFEPLPGAAIRASTVRLQHDRQGTIGYRFDTPGGVIGYATDLGHAPPALIAHLAGVDILCLECNYDEHMTIHSSRPSFVNRRNLSDSGHLSNEQSFEAVRAIAAASPAGNPQHVLLMHRSSQCNHPTKVRRVFERDAVLCRRVWLTDQRRRTRWFTARPLPARRRARLQWAF